ncbi:MAG: YfhO family protein [Bryobacteraceae bacterium]
MSWRRALPGLFLLAAALFFFRRPLFDSAYAIPWDLRSYHLPIATFVAESFSRGELPLWDPWTYCGRPLYANLTAQVFYPPAWPAFLLAGDSLLDALEWQIALHVALGGLLTYWLLRRLDIPVAAALAGATVFELGAFFASQSQHLGAVNAAAWLPLSWLGAWELRRRWRWRWFALLALSFALSLLAGFPAVTAAAIGSTLVLALALAPGWKAPLRVLAAIAWALLIAGVQLLPTLELTAQSVARFRADFFTRSAMPPAALLSLLWPDWHGIYDLAGYRGPWEPTFLYAWCGLATPALAIISLRDPLARRFAFVTLFCALWMIGCFDSITPRALAASSYPEFALAAFTLGAGVLAAFGAASINNARVAAAIAMFLAADLTLAGSGRPMNLVALSQEPGVTATQFDGSRRVLEVLRGLTRQTTPPSRIDTIDDSMAWAMAAPLTRVPSANGNDPFALESVLRVRMPLVPDGRRWGRYYQVARLDPELLGKLNVRYLLSRGRLPDPALREAAEVPGRIVYENPRLLPRFYLEKDSRPVRVQAYGAREVVIESDSSAPSLLVTSEAYYPGWRAYIDGMAAPMRTHLGAFRAVRVPQGRHEVRMRFEPSILMYGAGVSLAAAIALVLACRFFGDNEAGPENGVHRSA